MKKQLYSTLTTVLFGAILYYFMLPPINFHSIEFWGFVVLLIAIYTVSISSIKLGAFKLNTSSKFMFLKSFYGIIVIIGIIGGILIINLFCSPLFNAIDYSNRITINENKEFSEDVDEVDFNKLALIDKASSQKLGDRTMGQMTDLVSQFYVSDLYTQINFNNDIIRVTPLEYADVVKYFTNRKEGIKGYITVNSVNGESKLVTLNEGMRYMPSAMFFENLNRKLRISYPFDILGEASFEIDNNGNPYWIVPTYTYKGVGLKKEVDKVIVLDAITGKSTKYKIGEVPSWIDHVYSADLIIEQFDNWGEYKNGFWNSIFGQKNVVNTTEGYNYLAMEDDIYLYTGVTSVSTDESNLGFILTNLRTKETHYYTAPGAEEYSAMASAEGLVQEKRYTSTFPLLINLNGNPTYLMSLKDNAGLVKLYAFVDVEDYQKVITSDASLGIEAAANKFINESGVTSKSEILEKTIKIKKLTTAIIDGNTEYYIVDSNNNLYRVSIKINKNLIPFLEVGETVDISYTEDLNINVISIIKR